MRELSTTATAHLAKWDGTVAPARDAATILVTRSTSSGVEVLLMRRRPSMAFAAGMHVFPGGAVHAGDREPVSWIGPPSEAWGRRWSCEPQLAGALVVAAVRETFEETGILLAGRDERSVAGLVDGSDWTTARQALESGAVTFGHFLAERELKLRADLLAPWAHWITPDFEPRRFDTRFFLAALPAGAGDVRHGSEADSSFWIEPGEAVQAAEAGDIAMMAPTLANLRALRDVDPAAVVSGKGERPVTTVRPRLIYVDGRPLLTTQPDPASG
jgi:8-oxo-dGTP pyrophosphatase MutT (NUDIX family)